MQYARTNQNGPWIPAFWIGRAHLDAMSIIPTNRAVRALGSMHACADAGSVDNDFGCWLCRTNSSQWMEKEPLHPGWGADLQLRVRWLQCDCNKTNIPTNIGPDEPPQRPHRGLLVWMSVERAQSCGCPAKRGADGEVPEH